MDATAIMTCSVKNLQRAMHQNNKWVGGDILILMEQIGEPPREIRFLVMIINLHNLATYAASVSVSSASRPSICSLSFATLVPEFVLCSASAAHCSAASSHSRPWSEEYKVVNKNKGTG